ncbi:PucR family transcriptional regulator [Pseudoclavibacter helvolus]|uniref:Purine catabolism regulator n=1 Tax=Pseudoclavibacter helvolus TaxID=255205 RepID=A0A7W4UP69_9MICO|nr:PucR family transcriptional regulator [Pseudoclavibacter helvolus]MBB2957462.1 purine catabolism regulator [Pseudoclavibacter helvolus]
MLATVDTLLADRSLGLTLLTGAPTTRRTGIEWVATTELLNPQPFLTGGQLVLTTGMRLRGTRAYRSFVDSLVAADTVALGVGTGFTHESVPEALVAAAEQAGLPLFEVAYETPFAALTKIVTQASTDAQHSRLEGEHRQQQQLVTALLSDGGVTGLAARLGRLTRSHVAVTRLGELLAGSLDVQDEAVSGWDALPISTGQSAGATLHITSPRINEGLVNYARSLLSLQLMQDARRVRAARDASGLVLHDLVQGKFSVEDAERRLTALGVATGQAARVLVAETDERRTAELTALPLPAELQSSVSAVFDGRLVVIVPERTRMPAAAEALIGLARSAGIAARVGIGDLYPTSLALRWSYFEARDALQGAPQDVDVATSARLSISSLLLASRDVPVLELAAEVLGPLETHDTEHGSTLLATLDAYFSHSGQIAQVAEELGTHRNTVRYRLDQIASITGLDPRVMAEGVQLWLAGAARRLSPSGGMRN